MESWHGGFDRQNDLEKEVKPGSDRSAESSGTKRKKQMKQKSRSRKKRIIIILLSAASCAALALAGLMVYPSMKQENLNRSVSESQKCRKPIDQRIQCFGTVNDINIIMR